MIVYCIKNMYTTEENTGANKVSLYYTAHDTACKLLTTSVLT